MTDSAVLRIIDANANRAMEGLRVAEDYARFVLDDAHLTTVGKNLRHDLTAALAQYPFTQRAASRDTQADVGVSISTAGEKSRATLADIVAANLQRVKEAIRTIEECDKLASQAGSFEAIRYRVYSWEKSLAGVSLGQQSFADRRLYVLIDIDESLDNFRDRATALAAAGVDVIQLRDKQASDRELLQRARCLREIADAAGVLVVMNDRPDLAVLARADAVHVGQDELTVKDVRTIVGPEMLIGVSTHSGEQAKQAEDDGANYIGVGPTFPSTTKSFDQFTGVELLKQVAGSVGLPAYAIGGIALDKLDSVFAAGFTHVALSAAVANDPSSAAAFRELLNKA